jgi:hypothetical protein
MFTWIRRRRATRDFAAAIQPELRDVRGPEPTDALLDRILASRSAGTRVILPVDDTRRARPSIWYATGVIAAAVVVIAIAQRVLRGPADGISSAPSWFANIAIAQPVSAAIPPMSMGGAGRLHPLAVTYTRIQRNAGRERIAAHHSLLMTREVLNGTTAWRLVRNESETGSPRRKIDTVFVAADDLRPLAAQITETPYGSFTGIRISQRYDGLHVTGDMHATRTAGPEAHRTFDRMLPAGAAPFLFDALAPVYAMAFPLRAGWVGRASVMGWAVRDDDVSAMRTFRVDGEELIRVPAGEFDCWRIAIEGGGQRHLYWARKSDGLGVRSLAPDGSREIVLERESRR